MQVQAAPVHKHSGFVPEEINLRLADYYKNKKGRDHIADKIVADIEKQKELLSKEKIERRQIRAEKLTIKAEAKQALSDGKIKKALPDGQILKVYNMGQQTDWTKAVLKRDGPTLSNDSHINYAYDNTKATYDCFKLLFNIRSINNRGLPLQDYVHYGYAYNNAFWDGIRMVFGDGDGKIFNSFAKDIDISAHELSHGLTDYNAGTKINNGYPTGIDYVGQAGGINEGYSDMLGVTVKQWAYKKDPKNPANWLIGETLIKPTSDGRRYALRNMLNPGTAFVNHPALGTDTQIDHWGKYIQREQSGQVIDPHDSSGIVNKAFAIATINYMGLDLNTIVKIFFKTLPIVLPAETFKGLADKTISVAKANFGSDTKAQNALLIGWRAVGVLS